MYNHLAPQLSRGCGVVEKLSSKQQPDGFLVLQLVLQYMILSGVLRKMQLWGDSVLVVLGANERV